MRRRKSEETEREILEVEAAQLVVEIETLEVLKEIRHELHHPRTISLAVQFNSGAIQMPFDLVLNVGQTSTATVTPLEADGVTITPGAVLSDIIWTLSDPSVTTITNPDSTLSITGAAASTGAVSGTVSATVTDTGGVAPANLTQSFTVTVNAPTGLTTQLGVAFSTPTP